MLRACAIEFQGAWDEYLPVAEFAYNNSYRPVLKWPHMRHYMEENVDHLFVGMKLEKGEY